MNFPFESKEYTDPDAVRYEGDHCPTAISLRDETFTIFLHPNWEPEHIDLVIKAVCKVGSAMRA